MAKEATLQVRMDADLKEQVEKLYKELGTTFAEAVRIFAKQSVREKGMPFVVTANPQNTYKRLSKYADSVLQMEEDQAFEKAMMEKYGKIH